jgi:putative toxin-antitoxin system antitoxin component (TIGR02293 family)
MMGYLTQEGRAMTMNPADTLQILLPQSAEPGRSALDVALELRLGVPVLGLDAVRETTGLAMRDLLEVVPVSESTLKRRRQRGERLPADVADALFRLLHVFRLAQHVLGSTDKARNWLLTPTRALSHHRPLELLSSALGARIVEDELLALEHGFLA